MVVGLYDRTEGDQLDVLYVSDAFVTRKKAVKFKRMLKVFVRELGYRPNYVHFEVTRE